MASIWRRVFAIAALLPAGAIAQGAATTTETDAQPDPEQPDPEQADMMQDDAASPVPTDQPGAELPAGEEAMLYLLNVELIDPFTIPE